MSKQHSPRFLALVDGARACIRETDVKGVNMRLDDGDRFLLIDVREESEWAAGRIPGAVHLGKGIIERDIEQMVPNLDEPIILYCGGGFRSALAADTLSKMGYSNVESMDGGFSGWIDAGFEVERETA